MGKGAGAGSQRAVRGAVSRKTGWSRQSEGLLEGLSAGKRAGAGSQRVVRGASDREKGLSEGLFVGKGAGAGS